MSEVTSQSDGTENKPVQAAEAVSVPEAAPVAAKPAAKPAPKPAAKPALPAMLLASSPHIASPVSARRLMMNVLIGLIPVTLFGIIAFGWHALVTVIVSILFTELSEFCFRKATKQEPCNGDLSAAVTGLLLALVLPPSCPVWITALGAIFAILVAKEFFGGLGANVFNPALAGRAFLLMSFPVAMTTWNAVAPGLNWTSAAMAPILQSPVDGVTGATMLNFVKQISKAGNAAHWADYAQVLGLQNGGFGSILGVFFLGNRAGCIGETSILLILVGFAWLLATKTINWRTPVFMLIGAFVMTLVVKLSFAQAVMGLFAGGLLFGAVFMATDYVTTPVTDAGKIIFGLGAGIITVLIRSFGNYPEGVMFSILIMNMITPFLNRIVQKKYGFVKPIKPQAQPAGGAK